MKTSKEFVLVGRLSVLVVAIVAIAIAWSPNDTILNLVGNAWAGFGASFSPLVLFSLYWKKLTRGWCYHRYGSRCPCGNYMDCLD